MRVNLGFRAMVRTALPVPPAGQRALYAKEDGWLDVDHNGVERPLRGNQWHTGRGEPVDVPDSEAGDYYMDLDTYSVYRLT